MINRIFARIIICVIFLINHNLTQAQMRQIYVDSQHPGNEIKKLSFYSPSSGFVAFTDWIGFSSDSGHTFTKKYITLSNVDFSGYNVNLTFGFGISGVKAFNKDTVIAYGDYGAVPAILYSVDGANTFKLIFLSQYGTLRLANGIADMIFPGNNKIGYAVDADRVLKSTDKGLTWNVIRTDPDSYLNYLDATDDNNVFAFSQNYQVSKLIKTSDAGNTWQQVTIPTFTYSQIKYADFISPLKGWINIYDGGPTQRLYYTQDGGANWEQQSDDDATPFICGIMKFINDSTGFATKDFFDTYKTTDSGKIWEPLPRDNHFTYLYYSHNDMQIFNSIQLWAGGGNGFLELNTNIRGVTLPKAYFKIDTLPSNTVNLINFSKKGYQYKWTVNHVFLSNSYNTTYNHNNINVIDTIQLIVTNGTLSDTLVKYGYFINLPPPPIPSISSFTPTTGNPGTIISITGINFTGATAVYLGGMPASSFNVVSATNINATVGTGSSGSITVVTPYGTASQPGFTFRNMLKITSFSPSSGPAGSTVTINGANFSGTPSNNIVYFGAVEASVLTSTSTQLTVSVPAGATYLPMSVTVNGLTAYSTIPFVLTFAGGGTITKNTFPAKVDFSIDVASLYMANADFDVDGKPDIVVGNYSYFNRITLLRNNSTLNSVDFDPAKMIQLLPGYNTEFGPVATMDADGDGKQDIIAANGNTLSYLKNESASGDMKFASPIIIGGVFTEYITIADFDGDGRPDILCPGPNTPGIRIFQNATSGGNFSIKNGYTFIYYSGNRLDNVIAGDFDGDGKPDVVTMEYNGDYSINIYKNTSNAGIISFAHPIALPDPFPQNHKFYNLATGDFDGDGKLDLAATVENGYMTIFRNTTKNGVLSFAPGVNFPMNHLESAIVVGDLNGDGKPDLAMADFNFQSDTSNDIQAIVFENKSSPGNILFGPNVDFSYTSANHGSKNLCIADFDGDGIPEIAVENGGTDSLSILLRKEQNLPVTLIDFSGHLENNNTILAWHTASENNTSHFEVQRSNDGTHFSDIGSVEAAGNSNQVKSYTYIDPKVSQFNSKQLYYRLKEIDNDGKTQFSKVVSIMVDALSNEIRVYPNPANSIINVDYSQDLSTSSAIILYDMNGKKIIEKKNLNNSHHQQLNVSNLRAGTYSLILMENGKEKIIKSIVIGK